MEMISLYIKEIENVWFGVAYKKEKIFATTFARAEIRALRNLLRNIPFNIPFQRLEKPSKFAELVLNSIKAIYDGKETHSNFSLATECLTGYAKKVIGTVALIPVGYASSYGFVAKAAGGSPRAVGRVMALNPFAPIVPCHRVVNSDFTLGGYGGGLNVKLELLSRERRGYSFEKEISANDKNLRIFPVELVFRKLEKSKG
jgi:methylated-DNA-[protein]-cysteine S-methyltransferase